MERTAPSLIYKFSFYFPSSGSMLCPAEKCGLQAQENRVHKGRV